MESKWIYLNESNLCLKRDENFFRNIRIEYEKCLFEMKSNSDTYGICESKLWHYNDSYYCLTHKVINIEGWSFVRHFCIRSSMNLVDIYEYISLYKPMPTWEKFVEFVKECTLVKF